MKSDHQVRAIARLTLLGMLFAVSVANAQDEKKTEALWHVRSALESFNATIAQPPVVKEAWTDYFGLEELNEFLTDDEYEISPSDLDDDIKNLVRVERPLDVSRVREAISQLITFKNTSDGGEDVIGALKDLKSWISSNRMRTWQKLLIIDDAIDEIEAADEEDSTQIKEDGDTDEAEASSLKETERVLSLLVAEEQGDARRARLQLRRELTDFDDVLEFQVTDDLAKSSRKLKRDFRNVAPHRVTDLRQRAQSAVRRLGEFLQTGPEDRRYGWENYLKLPQLRAELNRHDWPAQRTLVQSYQQLDSGHPGLEKRRFEEARQALQDYLQVLRLAPSDQTIESKQLDLVRVVNALDVALAIAGEKKEEEWKEYLDWELLKEVTEDSSPSLRDLSRLINIFEADEDGLELSFFQRVKRELVTYAEMIQLDRGPQPLDRYRGQLELLTRSLEAHSDFPTATTAAELTDRLEWLRSTGYANDLSARVKAAFRRPNVRIVMNGEFFIQQITDTQNEATPINRCFEGAHVTGCARTTAHAKGQLVPQENGIAIDILVNGTTIANTVGRQRKVSVFAHGVTSSIGQKRIYFTLNGLTSTPATADAYTNQAICGAHVDRRIGRRLIGRFAKRKARKTVPKAERMANDEARETVASRLDRQTNEMLSKANSQFQQQMAKLRRGGFYPDDVHLRSTSTDILLDAMFASGSYLGAPSDPPKLEMSGAVKAQIHESLANNMLAKVFGGRQIDNEWLVDFMQTNGLEVPDELLPPSQRSKKPKKTRRDIKSAADNEEEAEDNDEQEKKEESKEEKSEFWSMTFDRRFPVIVRFNDEGVNIAIRGREFHNADQEISELIEMSAQYRLKKTADGKLEAKRVGDVDVIFINSPGRLDGRQLAYKTFLLRKMDPLFRETFSTDELPQVGQMSQLINGIKLESLESARGWLSANVDIDPSVVSSLMPMK